jgi:hypothetical protein
MLIVSHVLTYTEAMSIDIDEAVRLQNLFYRVNGYAAT